MVASPRTGLRCSRCWRSQTCISPAGNLRPPDDTRPSGPAPRCELAALTRKNVRLSRKRSHRRVDQSFPKKDALAAFDVFVETWGVKYDKAVECLVKDRDALLAFYEFPAEHWKHLRTTNVIESSFATVRHRTGALEGMSFE